MYRALILLFVWLSACGADPVELPPPPDDDVVQLVHHFGELPLAALSDDGDRCVTWTPGNTRPLYVQEVALQNEGGFHHSNWFVVPPDAFPGDDGVWTCDDRGFSDLMAGALGTVLFAQSTQAYEERQRLGDGAVIKIPPGWVVLGSLHTLNATPRDTSSNLWLTLGLTHPRDVATVVLPMSMQYIDLALPPQAHSTFRTECDWQDLYAASTGEDLWFRVHYVLPHTHAMGERFELSVLGGPQDGEVLFSHEGFDGTASGRTFDPPLDVFGADGLTMTCGFDNATDDTVGWGNGDGEMCVALVLAEAPTLFGGSAAFGSEWVGEVGGVQQHEAPCLAVFRPLGDDFGLPTDAEREAGFEDLDSDEVTDVGPTCADTPPGVAAGGPPTLTALRESVFTPSCGFSSCHGEAAAAGLDLISDGVHGRLLGHAVQADTSRPLVAPGDPDGSWLMELLTSCAPTDDAGTPVAFMPRNATVLLDPEVVAQVRDWIAAGADDD